MKPLKEITTPLIDNNPIALQVLGICSALAVTVSVYPTLIMCIALTLVVAFSNLAVSLIRHYIPVNVRIVIQMTIISSLVIVVDQILQAFFFEVSKQLSVFVGLIITNCIVLGRAEGFAMQNPPVASFLDGVGNGLGYSWVLIAVATIREILGSGTWFDLPVVKTLEDGGWYQPNGLFLLPPAAFFIIGFLIWGIRSVRPAQIKTPEFHIQIDPVVVAR